MKKSSRTDFAWKSPVSFAWEGKIREINGSNVKNYLINPELELVVTSDDEEELRYLW